jgi:hypothetical protein
MSSGLPDTEIGYSPVRLLKLLGLGIVMTLVSAAMAFNWYHAPNIGEFRIAVGYCGVALFGFATFRSLWLLISSRKPVVFISSNGILDTRISDQLIEWKSIEVISMWQYRRQKLVVLKLTPLIAKRLEGSRLRRLLSSANKAIGVDGVTINSAGLSMDPKTLYDTCMRYRAAAGSVHSGALELR